MVPLELNLGPRCGAIQGFHRFAFRLHLASLASTARGISGRIAPKPDLGVRRRQEPVMMVPRTNLPAGEHAETKEVPRC